MVVGVMALAVPAAARAGTYAVVSCPGDDGWSQAAPSALFVPYADDCGGDAVGGLDLALGPNPEGGYATTTGGAITFQAPAGMAISAYSMQVNAYGGPCAIVSNQCANGFGDVQVDHTGQADPDYDYRNLGYGTQTPDLTVGPLPSGVNWVTVSVGCDGGPGGYSCPGSQAAAPEASAQVTSAAFVISTTATPTAIGFTGSLLTGTANGTANVQFTAADPGGPGIYKVTATVDGSAVYDATPEGNSGACATLGTYTDGSLAFDQLVPCPTQETVDIPVNTAMLSDGAHDLKITVTDAAQNSTTVLDQTITTQNSTTVSGLLPSPPSIVTSPRYALALTRHTQLLSRGVARRYPNSALKLTGTLKSSTGGAAPGVSVALWARPAGTGKFILVSRTSTDGTGTWTLAAPRGPSRLLRVVAGSSATPTRTVNAASVTETVTPALSLHVATPGAGRIVFTGRLTIAPLGDPRPFVFIETRGPDGWEEVGSPVRVDATGHFRYVYQSSPLTLGRRFNFRATTPATESWQDAHSTTRVAEVH
jgi:hypothetical protein